MQTHGGDAAAAVIEGYEREFSIVARVDWNRDGEWDHDLSNLSPWVAELTRDGELTGSVSGDISIASGAAAAEAELTLAGEHNGRPLTQVFSPYNVASPLYLASLEGSPVYLALIVHHAEGSTEYPQLHGFVRKLDVKRADGTVTVQILDRVELLRRPVRFQKWGILPEYQYTGQDAGGDLDANLVRPQWIIDNCLRQCDVSPTNARPLTQAEADSVEGSEQGITQLWVSGTGSLYCTYGLMSPGEFLLPVPSDGDPPLFREGAPHPDNDSNDPAPLAINGAGEPFARDADPAAAYTGQDTYAAAFDATHYVTLTLLDLADDRVHREGGVVVVNLITAVENQILVTLESSGDDIDLTILIASSDGQAEVSESLADYDLPLTLTLGIDSTDVDTTGRLWTALLVNGSTAQDWTSHSDYGRGTSTGTYPGTYAYLYYFAGIQNFGYVMQAGLRGRDEALSASCASATPSYRAVLDVGTNRVSYYPSNITGDDAWDIIKGIVEAEWASAFWDDDGVFRFWTYDTLRSKQADTVREFSLDLLQDLSVNRSLDTVRNTFTVKTQKVVISDDQIFDVEEDYDGELVVDALETKHIRRSNSDVISFGDMLLDRYSTKVDESDSSRWTDDVENGYVVQFHLNGEWKESTTISTVSVYARFDVNDDVYITIENNSGFKIRFQTDDGDPALRVRAIVPDDKGTFDDLYRYRDSIDIYGERNLKLESDWYQTGIAHEGLVDRLAERSKQAVPVAEDVEVPGDPRVQYGDTVRLRDVSGIGSVKAQVTGIKRKWSPSGGLTDTYTVELLAPERAWVLGDPQWSVLGKSTRLTGGEIQLQARGTFNADVDGWASYAGSLSWNDDVDYVDEGAGSCKVTPDGDSDIAVLQARSGNETLVMSDREYRLRVRALFTWGADVVTELLWFNHKHRDLGSSSETHTVRSGEWETLSMDVDPPGDARWVRVRVYQKNSPTTSDVYYVDSVKLLVGGERDGATET